MLTEIVSGRSERSLLTAVAVGGGDCSLEAKPHQGQGEGELAISPVTQVKVTHM